jgi:HPt (histidine-containing phosphotransfer) domain-containing protein
MTTRLLPVLDLTTALSAMGDDHEIYEAVLGAYLKSMPSLLRDLDAAARSDDRSVVRRCAHSIKSSSQTIGGMHLGVAAATLEQISSTAGNDEIKQQAAALRILFADLITALNDAGFAAE